MTDMARIRKIKKVKGKEHALTVAAGTVKGIGFNHSLMASQFTIQTKNAVIVVDVPLADLLQVLAFGLEELGKFMEKTRG